MNTAKRKATETSTRGPKLKSEKRSSLRFKPDLGDYGLIDFEPKRGFAPSVMALLLNESYTGCAMLALMEKPLEKGMQVKVKAGRLKEMLAEVVWTHPIDDGVYKIGFKYLE